MGRGRVNLPPELVVRGFVKLDELRSGAEADVLLAEDESGAEWVVKLYRPGLTFDDVASELLAEADSAHVVRIAESGFSSEFDQRFEVLEYCEPGSLRDALDRGERFDLTEIVRELAEALEHIHSLRVGNEEDRRLVHRDVKPENVLVRSVRPLDLVLGDFGLARMIAGSVHLTNRQQGSRAYAPPSGEGNSTGWDWWSLGMLVAELAAGIHPFKVDDDWLSEAAIDHLLSQGPVDLSSLDDARVAHLCRGLLTRRTADRWGAKEVRRWLAGEQVPVAADRGADRRVQGVLFNDAEYTDPVELALALQERWDEVVERLMQRTDQLLVQQVEVFLAGHDLPAAVSTLSGSTNPHLRLASLLIELNPHLPPLYRRHDIRPLSLARDLSDTSDPRAEQVVDLIESPKYGLIETRVLPLWRGLEGMEAAPDAERRVQEAREYLAECRAVLSEQGLGEEGATELTARVYAAALDPSVLDRARDVLARTDTEHARQVSWWSDIAVDTKPYSVLLALVTEGLATNEATAEERAAAEARERRRIERRDRRRRIRRRLTALFAVAAGAAVGGLSGMWLWPPGYTEFTNGSIGGMERLMSTADKYRMMVGNSDGRDELRAGAAQLGMIYGVVTLIVACVLLSRWRLAGLLLGALALGGAAVATWLIPTQAAAGDYQPMYGGTHCAHDVNLPSEPPWYELCKFSHGDGVELVVMAVPHPDVGPPEVHSATALADWRVDARAVSASMYGETVVASDGEEIRAFDGRSGDALWTVQMADVRAAAGLDDDDTVGVRLTDLSDWTYVSSRLLPTSVLDEAASGSVFVVVQESFYRQGEALLDAADGGIVAVASVGSRGWLVPGAHDPDQSAAPDTLPAPDHSAAPGNLPAPDYAAQFLSIVNPLNCALQARYNVELFVMGEDLEFSVDEWPMLQSPLNDAWAKEGAAWRQAASAVTSSTWPIALHADIDLLLEQWTAEAEQAERLATAGTLEEWNAAATNVEVFDERASDALRGQLDLPPAAESLRGVSCP
jgi:serine/threonine protein kinase